MSRFTHVLRSVDDRLFRAPYLVLTLILIVTLFFASRIPGLKMYSDFADLLPQEHPYIQLHNEIRDTFGGANVVIIGITVEDGTIFTNETLGLIHRLTEELRHVEHEKAGQDRRHQGDRHARAISERHGGDPPQDAGIQIGYVGAISGVGLGIKARGAA